jgi:hypothetical protein
MQKPKFLISLFLFFFPVFVFAEEITITTYYPSPYGVYRELRAQRIAIGDNYINGATYCWEGTCTNTIDVNADFVVEGNVGIGTVSPKRKLEVADAVVFNSGSGNLDSNDITFLKNSAKLLIGWNRSRGSGEADFINNRGAGNPGGFSFIDYANDGTETTLVTMLGTGKVGIGTTSPTYQLQLSTDSAAKPSTTTWSITSDRRVKKDIRPYTNGLKIIRGINPVWFKYNGKAGFAEDNQKHIGVIAQEIIKVAPYTVNTFKTKLNPQDKEETELLNFNPHALIFDLINSVKELDIDIAKLTGDNQELRRDNKELKLELENLKTRLARLEEK